MIRDVPVASRFSAGSAHHRRNRSHHPHTAGSAPWCPPPGWYLPEGRPSRARPQTRSDHRCHWMGSPTRLQRPRMRQGTADASRSPVQRAVAGPRVITEQLAQGRCDLAWVCAATRAGTSCGSCRPEVLKLLTSRIQTLALRPPGNALSDPPSPHAADPLRV
jgi:bacterioferritin-associated ferredoxin